MVAADMANLRPNAAELEVEALAEHDLDEPASNQIVARSPSTAQSDGRSGGAGGSQYTCSLIFSMWSA